MDSRLLNVFHDDPFDGSYVKYDENNTDFWTNSSETLGLQLSETLHGILPIAPTEDESVLYGNTILKDDYTLEYKNDNDASMQTSKNAVIYEDFVEHNVSASGAIEIVTVNPDGEDSGNDDSDTDNESEENHFDEFDTLSQQSCATFRSRTDSSSIGDYESHSSDYDDDTDDYNDGDDEFIANTTNLKRPLQTNARFTSKNRTLSTNTVGSDVDGLGLQIDANTFDLAEFITKDDFTMVNSFSKATNKKCSQITNTTSQFATSTIPPDAAPVQIISSHKVDSDSDSDVIVDVETIEFGVEEKNQLWSEKLNSEILKEKTKNNREDITFEDNVNTDPSWTPQGKTNQKKEISTKETKATATTSPTLSSPNQNSQNPQLQTKFSRSFSVVPSKRQCDILKGKFGSGRGKNTSMQQRTHKTGASKPSESKLESTQKTQKIGQNAEGSNTSVSGRKSIAKQSKEPNQMNLGIGQGGKNLSLIKHDRNSISEQSCEADMTPEKMCNAHLENEQVPNEHPERRSVKRKLNLEEYKKRIGERKAENIGINSSPSSKTAKLDTVISKNEPHNSVQNKIPCLVQKGNSIGTCRNNTAVASIVQSLKEQAKQPPKASVDPITEAKNKVLRMQELKKAQLLKIIDSTVSAKVPRVTKVLPLKDMVTSSNGKCATTNAQSNKNALKVNEEYEEIVIVSASSNTIISIPPINKINNYKQIAGASKLGVNNASRSLLKSSALLYKISNTFQKVQESENVKITPNSLITSIQNVVVNQTSCVSCPVNEVSELACLEDGVANRKTFDSSASGVNFKNDINAGQHGEDKIIMHLRKDRIRNPTSSISTQTDILAEFPPLPLPLPSNTVERKSRERKRRKRAARNYRVRRHIESPDKYHKESGSDISSCCDDNRSYRSRSRSCTGDNCSSSPEYFRKLDGVCGGGYSSRSSRRHRSSISSSYSESERKPISRSRKSYYRKYKSFKKYGRSSSSSSSDFSDRSRSRSRSRNRNRNRSRSFSRSPLRRSRSRSCSKRFFQDRNVSQPAVEERRIVYVGRIEQETNKEMLRRKFIAYGPIKQITLHYKETGMKYGFVTYERSQDAFNVIDNSAKDSHISMYDISFGGRRAFCRASYADLDNAGINTYQSYVFPQSTTAPKEEDSFEALLLKVKAKLNASKMSTNAASAAPKI